MTDQRRRMHSPPHTRASVGPEDPTERYEEPAADESAHAASIVEPLTTHL